MIAYKGAIRFQNGSNRLAYGSLGVLKASLPTLKADAQGKILVVHAYSFAMTTPKQNVRISSSGALRSKRRLLVSESVRMTLYMPVWAAEQTNNVNAQWATA